MSKLLFRDDYHDKFPPVTYLQNRYSTFDEDWVQFQVEHGFSFLRHESVFGSRLLDLGCGPNLVNVIGAPDNFTGIVMADFSHANMDVIRRTLAGDDVGFDWNHVCEHYSHKYGLGADFEISYCCFGASWEKSRLATLISSVKQVVHCDVLKSEPLGPEYTSSFDCVYSSYCIETAVKNIETYNQALKNAVSLLRDDGHLILRGPLDEKVYHVSNNDFSAFPVREGELRSATDQAGLCVIDLEIKHLDEKQNKLGLNRGYCMLAQKPCIWD